MANSAMEPTLILGGGIIGLSTAYYLSLYQPDMEIHILDSAPSLLMSASGYAGGFLAKDWFSPASTSLGALSFRLHKELAEAHDGTRKWGYSRSMAYSLSVDEFGVSGQSGKRIRGEDEDSSKDWLEQGASRANTAKPSDNNNVISNGDGAERNEMLNADGTPAWITKQDGGTLDTISSADGCAQVEPRELCEFLLDEIQRRNVHIHLNTKATGLTYDANGKISGVKTSRPTNPSSETTIHGRNIIITSGAWSSSVFKTLFPTSRTRLDIGPLAGYSITVRSPRYSKPILDPSRHNDTGTCHSVFCGPGPNWSYAPEAIARMTKSGQPEVYVTGLNDSNMPLPPDVTGVKGMCDAEKLKDLKRTTVFLTGLSREGDDLVDDDLEVVREGLCLRPVTGSGKPVVARLDERMLGSGVAVGDGGGVFVAAGHGPWGISLSLGTGLVVSELVQGRKTSADVRALGIR